MTALTLLLLLLGLLSASLAESLFAPAFTSFNDNGPLTVGLTFSTLVSGYVTGVKFYKGSGNTGVHVGALYSPTGALLAQANFTSETAEGWQTVSLPNVRVIQGNTYTAAVFLPVGHYAVTSFFAWPVTSGNVTGYSGTFFYGSALGYPNNGYQSSNYYVDVVFTNETLPTAATPAPTSTPKATTAPTSAPTPTPTPKPPTSAPTSAPTSTPKATTAPTSAPTPTPTPTPQPTSIPAGWPDASNTGVPQGTVLTAYTGPCIITTPNTVINAKIINCDLEIRTTGVSVTKSKITGSIATDENSVGYSYTISDSYIDAGNRAATGVGAVNFVATRVHVYGGNRSFHCWKNCTVQDSYMHGQFRDASGTVHESGMRMGEGATFKHNTITCDAPDVLPDGGCSAGLTGYGDFAPVRNNLIENNFFKATTGGFCAYGGSSQGKPYSNDAANIRFINNVFEKGSGGKCGYWGPITSFDESKPGNLWSNNRWAETGALVPPSN